VRVASIKPSFLELIATRLINLDRANDVSSHGRAAQVASISKPVLKAKAKAPLSSVTSSFNLRHYSKGKQTATARFGCRTAITEMHSMVGRCRLTLSNPR
jgi:hypothetical protein